MWWFRKYKSREKLCNQFGLIVNVIHYPPDYSKWNPVVHRLLSAEPLEHKNIHERFNFDARNRWNIEFDISRKLFRFAHNWNDGTVEIWNDGFKENET